MSPDGRWWVPTLRGLRPRVWGLALAAFGIAINEWTPASVLSKSGALNSYQSAVVRAFNLIAVGSGLFSCVRPGAQLAAARRMAVQYPRASALLLGLSLAALLVDESRRAFRDGFRSDDFWFVAYPGLASRYLPAQGPELKRLGVRVLELPAVPDSTEQGWTIPGDFHPSPATHRKAARSLAAALPDCAGAAAGPQAEAAPSAKNPAAHLGLRRSAALRRASAFP